MAKTVAIVLPDKRAAFSIEEITLEEPQDDEIIVDMVASGICHTDLNVQNGGLPVGGYPIVVGHEGSGIVKQVGSKVSHLKPGDHVLLSHAYCGTCTPCKEGHRTYCMTYHVMNFGGRRNDGSCTAFNEKGPVVARFFGQSSFAKTSVVHRTSAIPIQDLTEAELRQLAPFGCGLMTGAATVPNLLKAEKGQSIAIFGAGGVGFGALFMAKSIGCDPIIVVELNEGRLALAKELGATHTINPKTEKDVVAKIQEITNGDGVHCAVETTANEQAQAAAITGVKKLGRVGIIGSGGGKQVKVSTEEIIKHGTQIIGVAMGDANTNQFIPMMVEEYRAGRFPVNRLTKFYSPEDVNQAVHDMETGEVIKPVLVWR